MAMPVRRVQPGTQSKTANAASSTPVPMITPNRQGNQSGNMSIAPLGSSK